MKPLIRKEGVKKEKIENYKDLKISDYFREASWEEAIELSAKNLNSIYSENNP